MTDFEIPSSFKGRVENFETPDWRHGEDEHPYRTSTLGIALREVFCLCRELGHPDEAELVAGEALIERHSRYPSVPAASASGGHGASRQGP